MGKNVILNLRGGLGNQMIQYAFARSISDKIFINKAYYEVEKNCKYELDKFNIHYDIPTQEDLSNEFTYYKYDDTINSFIVDNKSSSSSVDHSNIVLEGYFQTSKCLKDIDFNKYFNLDIEVPDYDVAIHIRGGDYVGWDFFDVLTPDYYKRACSFIEPGDRVRVFTNDREYADYCLYMVDDSDFIFDEERDSAKSLWRLSKAKKVIIGSNSSFAFCGIALSDCMSVLPSKWFNTDKDIDLNFKSTYTINP